MKKLSAIILICSMILGIFAFDVSAYSDVSGYELTKATGLLNELGIMYGYEGNVFKPDDLITRAEFAVVTARMINVSEKNESGLNYYTDVPKLHFAAGAINNLTERGILAGDPSGLFRPDDNVTAAEAYKMMLCIIGYSDYLEQKGGWPVGCMALANQVEISIGSDPEKVLTRAEVASLAVKTLEAPYFEGIVFNTNGNIEYRPNEDMNLLSLYRDVYKVEGQVTAVPGTTLVEETEYEENEIYIDGELYLYDGEDIKDLIGSAIDAYYYQPTENADKEIIFIAEKSGSSDELVINAEDIVSFSKSSGILKYYKNDKLYSATIAKNVSVIRNNVAVTTVTDDTFTIQNGSVVLKSSTGKSAYDVVIIQDYKNYVIGTLDNSGEKAYDYFNPTETIDLNSENVRILDASGNEITILDLKAKDVLSVMSGSKSYSEIYVSNGLMSGVIDKVVTKDKTTYTIDGTDFEVDADLLKKAKVEAKAGDNIKYTLDIFGKIAYYEVVRELEFGYVTNVKGLVFEDLQIKIFCSNGSFKVFDCAGSVKVNGDKLTDMTSVMNYFKKDGETVPQLVRYKVNTQGEIIELETASTTVKPEGLQINKQKGVRGWKIAGYFAQDIIINNETLIFSVPANPKTASEDDYTMMSRDNLSEALTYDVASYKTKSKVGYEEVVVIWNNEAGASAVGNTYAMVESTGMAVNDDGAMVEYISVYNGASKTQWIAREGYSFADKGISIGDIVRPALNPKGELISIELVYDCDGGGRPIFSTQTADFHAMERVMFGYATDLVDTIFTLSYYPDGADTYRYNIPNTIVMVYDPSKREGQQIFQGSMGDILMYANVKEACSRFVLQSRYEQAKVIYVYK